MRLFFIHFSLILFFVSGVLVFQNCSGFNYTDREKLNGNNFLSSFYQRNRNSRMMPNDGNSRENAYFGGNGSTVSWDGRIFIVSQAGPNGEQSWVWRNLQPESVERTNSGKYNFTQAWSEEMVILKLKPGEKAVTPNGQESFLHHLNALALVPASGSNPGDNPFPCNAQAIADANGLYECAPAFLFTQLYNDMPPTIAIPIFRVYLIFLFWVE